MMRLLENGKGLTGVQFAFDVNEELNHVEPKTALLKEAVRQLSEYFAGERTAFSLPLDPKGTDFQKRTWDALQLIPYGETRTYKQIAEAIDCPKGCRAVGMANNRNPLAIVIPCHRVIGANGDLVGYASGLDVKRKLLEMERDDIN
jgi:methylated-DNA-[protein]-cysteine S-methyltransferase